MAYLPNRIDSIYLFKMLTTGQCSQYVKGKKPNYIHTVSLFIKYTHTQGRTGIVNTNMRIMLVISG